MSSEAFSCPNCHKQMLEVTAVQGPYWHCEACKGSFLSSNVLIRIGTGDIVEKLWETSAKKGQEGLKKCPVCTKQMTNFHFKSDACLIELDICHKCRWVWFDGGEIKDIPKFRENEIRPATPEELKIKAKQSMKQLTREENDFSSFFLDTLRIIGKIARFLK